MNSLEDIVDVGMSLNVHINNNINKETNEIIREFKARLMKSCDIENIFEIDTVEDAKKLENLYMYLKSVLSLYKNSSKRCFRNVVIINNDSLYSRAVSRAINEQICAIRKKGKWVNFQVIVFGHEILGDGRTPTVEF